MDIITARAIEYADCISAEGYLLSVYVPGKVTGKN